jgi:hypothetical protein
VGVLRVESARLPWRALRPLLLAGAAATAWLALSAPAASADSADSGSLLGGISSSVSSIAGTAAADAPAVAALPAQPVTPEPEDLLQPLTGPVTGTVDYLIETVPVVNQIVPAGNIGTVTAPVVTAADTIVAEAADTVLPTANDALPVLDPILEPVEELLSGIDSLPLAESEAVAPDPAVVLDISAFDGGFGTDVEPDLGGPFNASPDSSELSATPDSAASLPAARPGSARSTAAPAGSLESPGNGEAAPGPHELPAVPGSGSGTSQSSGAGPGGTAWLSTFHLDVPPAGVFPVSGPLQNSPAPVSFDPGSSPD